MLNHSSRLLTSHNGQHPFLHPQQGSSEDTPQNDAGLGHSPCAWLFGSLLFALTSHAFTALQLFLCCPFPNDLGGMEACASLPFTVLQINSVVLYLYDHSCQGEAWWISLLSSLFTSPLSSCHVCLQTSEPNNCKRRHSCGSITMTNIASWLLYAPLSTSICCCFAYQSITVNQGISSSLLRPACMGAPVQACCS